MSGQQLAFGLEKGWCGLLGKHDRLHAGDLEAFPATNILAGHQIILAQHVGAGFGEASAVPFVGTTGELTLLGSYHPGDFILGRLMAVRTI